MQTRAWLRILACTLVLLLGAAAASGQQDASPEAWLAKFAASERGRPGADAGPTDVEAMLFVIDLMRVEDVEQAFTADFMVQLRWSDPRLALPDDAEPSIRSVALSEIWHPGVLVVNPRSLAQQLPQRISVDNAGGCSYQQRYIGALSFSLDLREFPFDTQEFSIDLLAAMHTPEQVNFILADGVSGRADELTIVDWKVGPGEFEVAPARLRSEGVAWAGMRAVLRAERYTNYFLLKVIVPLVIIVAMSWIVFWVSPKLPAPQIALGATSVLTLVAYRFLLGNLVPRVSYFTRLDIFILGATVLVFLALVEAVLTGNLAANDRLSLAMRIDRVSRALFPIVFVVLIVVAFR